MEPAIDYSHLSKTYTQGLLGMGQPVHALKDVSLSIASGEIVGLVGPNGAGKSTLMNLTTGLLLPSEGSVCVHGHPARSLEARRCIGYMPELPTFLGLYNPRKVLRYHGALAGLARRDLNGRIDELIERVELTHAANRRSATFSQGMRQRLALAVALISRPRVLILDEPTNGLDPVGIVDVRRMLLQLRETGMTILVSSHRLSELDKLVSSVVMLADGQLVERSSESVSQADVRVFVGVAAGSCGDHILEGFTVVERTDAAIIFSLDSTDSIPVLVRTLVQRGAEITSVKLEGDDLESRLLRLLEQRK
jgi:ABC-2 type transport system ATP-binding protein